MKTIFRFLLSMFAISSVGMQTLFAQWVQTNGPYGGTITSLAVSGTNLFAGTGGGVFLSTNNGTSWTAVNTGLTNTYVRTLAVSGTNLFTGTAGGGVFLSTNNGTSWTAVNNGLPSTSVRTLAVSGTNLFAGIYDDGIFLSTNNGTSWTAVNTGLPYTEVRTLAVSGTNLFAGTAGGVWRRPLSEIITSISLLPREIPQGFTLEQNFPNPFNPATKINFSIPHGEFVTLIVYDILGREVASLVNEFMEAGNYEVTFNADKFCSAIYYYRMQAGTFSEIKKLVLLR